MDLLTQDIATTHRGSSQHKPGRFRFAQSLFGWRTRFSFGLLEGLVLAAYVAVVSFALPHHAPWSDEAQAWLIARDSSFWELIGKRLHYEGSPPLWHVLLWAFHRAGGTYAGIGWLGATFAVLGILIWLRWSPFPLLIRALLPFTFFFAYQYAIIARGYVLYAPLAFSLCILFRRKRHLAFAIVAGLLSLLCIQGLLLAGLVTLLYVADFYRAQEFITLPRPLLVGRALLFELYRTQSILLSQQLRRRLLLAGGLLASLVFAGVIIASPAPDLNFMAGAGGSGLVHDTIGAVIGHVPRNAPDALADPYLFPNPDPPKPHLLHDPAGWAAWEINYRPFADKAGHYGPQSFGSQVLEFLVGAASQATWPIATSNLLACCFLALLALWLRTQRMLYAMLPWAIIIFFGQLLWVADHHGGMLLIALLCGIWIAVERRGPLPESSLLERAALLAFSVVLALQIHWSWFCIHRELRDPYDPGRETAEFMKGHPVARTAGFHFFITGIEPYFNSNPFFNTRSSFWLWSYYADPDPHHRATIASHPERVILTEEFVGTAQMRNQWAPVSRFLTPEEEKILPRDWVARNLWASGYRETHRFCGERFARLGTSYRDCNIIFEPTY